MAQHPREAPRAGAASVAIADVPTPAARDVTGSPPAVANYTRVLNVLGSGVPCAGANALGRSVSGAALRTKPLRCKGEHALATRLRLVLNPAPVRAVTPLTSVDPNVAIGNHAVVPRGTDTREARNAAQMAFAIKVANKAFCPRGGLLALATRTRCGLHPLGPIDKAAATGRVDDPASLHAPQIGCT